MIGFATVKVPFAGSIGADASYYWLGTNALAAMALGGWLLREAVQAKLLRVLTLAAVALIGASYLLGVDGGWPALAILLVAGWTALRWRRTSLATPT